MQVLLQKQKQINDDQVFFFFKKKRDSIESYKFSNLPTPLFAGAIVFPPSLERLPSGNI